MFEIIVTDVQKVNILWHGKGPKTGTCECGNELSGSVKYGELIE